MQTLPQDTDRLLGMIADHLDIPRSYYEKAAARHRSLGEWLLREGSKVALFDPDIRPQGSFRFGTVIRPLHEGAEYDLDNVCVLRIMSKSHLTQQQLKGLYGDEIKGYAFANDMIAPVTEHNRCWRLRYADEVEFHLDTLPCVPEDAATMQRIMEAGVPWDLARRAVAITDRHHPRYRLITTDWPSSNPRGFAAWFESQAALGIRRAFSESKARATIEDVPPYEWRTPLQRSIQILKRHRDVMFLEKPELAPISMILTNLAAHAYAGETELVSALKNIVEKIPEFVRDEWPRVPNPADPAEDYADKWASDPRLEKSFWDWHTAVKADLNSLPTLLRGHLLKARIQRLLHVELTASELSQFEPRLSTLPRANVAPALIQSAPRPWGLGD